jgi:hypothetical protein
MKIGRVVNDLAIGLIRRIRRVAISPAFFEFANGSADPIELQFTRST